MRMKVKFYISLIGNLLYFLTVHLDKIETQIRDLCKRTREYNIKTSKEPLKLAANLKVDFNEVDHIFTQKNEKIKTAVEKMDKNDKGQKVFTIEKIESILESLKGIV
jgi:hypothetical protein